MANEEESERHADGARMRGESPLAKAIRHSDASLVHDGSSRAKAELRREILARRAAVAQEERDAWNRAIRFALLTSERWMAARTVLAYFAMPDEVATLGLLSAALADGKRLALPRCLPREKRFEAVEVTDLARDLEMSRFRGLHEPARHLPAWDRARDGELDLAIVPGVAFDRKGHRLGFGAGMYDRFFAEWDGPAPESRPWRLALAYSIQVAESLPADAHDQPVDEILTEQGWMKVNP